MDSIKSGKINCIIVKDFSRLGRNYIETGRYLEDILPMYGVRVISILDHYDNISQSGTADGIIVPFKNLINDSYCRDISMKIRRNFEVKRKTGQFIGSFAPYGYAKDPNNKNRLVVDPYAADVVKQIFRMKLEGYSSAKIAEALNSVGVLPPSEYKRFCGLNFSGGYRCGDKPLWTYVPVNRILRNEMYTGTMIQGVNIKPSYRSKKIQQTPKENWIKVKNTHEAIIPQEIFDRMQELLLLDTRKPPNTDKVCLFSGLIRCGDCGNNLVRRQSKSGGKVRHYYHCLTYKRGEGCSSHNVSEVLLCSVILSAIKKQSELVMRGEQMLKQIKRYSMENFNVKAIDKQIETLLKEIERYGSLRTNLYSDKADGVISEDEYIELSRRFEVKADEAKQKCNRLKAKKEELYTNGLKLQPWMENFKKYRNITELTREVVVALIDSIVVYDKTRITVNFRYKDELNDLLMLAEDNT